LINSTSVAPDCRFLLLFNSFLHPCCCCCCCLQGPRIAHWLLPIPKNPRIGSEWWYAWVPVLGPLCGGVLAGGLFKAYVGILKGQVSVDSNPW
jgi:hypothetical protein